MKTLKFLTNIVLALLMGTAIGQEAQVNGLYPAAAIFLAGQLVTMPSNVLAGGIQVEIWEDIIAKNLFKGYEWLRRSKNRDRNVLMGKFVYIPQAGAKPTVTRNRTNYPITVTQRTDTTKMYEIDEFSTEAILIPDADTIELSYDKTMDVLGDHMKALNEEVARWSLYNWTASNAANILRSTGSTSASYLSGTTGNRKDYIPADLAFAKTALINNTKKEKGDRVAAMTEDAYNQIKGHTSLASLDNHAALGAVFKDGDLVRLHGFDIVRVEVAPRYTNAGTPVKIAPGVANAASNNDAIVCYDTEFVHLAKGEIKFFETLGDASYQGDVYSAKVRAGSSGEYTDEEGVVTIVQEP